MNPDGLSPEATARLAQQQAGRVGDLAVPDFGDLGAVATWRAAQHADWGTGATDGEAEHVAATIAGVDCLVAGPTGAPTVMYLHGGGFCLGSPGTALPITARLATRLRVVSVDYRLAPEHPFPSGLDDAISVFGELIAEAPVALAGDSAGGNLALGVALANNVKPAAIALLCPHLDFREPPASTEMEVMSPAYLGAASTANPLASPLAAPVEQLAELPSVLIQTTTTEAMHPQAIALAARIGSSGGDSTLQVWNGLWHAWHYHRDLPEAWGAVDCARDWLLARL